MTIRTVALAAILLALAPALPAQPDVGFALDAKPDRLVVTRAARPVAEFVYADPKILRPYFANLHAPSGGRVTRTHPPIPGTDATDHDTMHPGVWLAFGDLAGQDFWRNKASIWHVRFLTEPRATKDAVSFATESRMRTADGTDLAKMTCRFGLTARPAGWLLTWDATLSADVRELVFGDQEEMGFGARVATELTEKNGGTVRAANGKTGAKSAWGHPAAWCDYADGQRGITLMAAPGNFREPWWHTRDYGLAVANPFGRAAFKQGARSEVTIRRGEELRLVFGAVVHAGAGYDPTAEYAHFRAAVAR